MGRRCGKRVRSIEDGYSHNRTARGNITADLRSAARHNLRRAVGKYHRIESVLISEPGAGSVDEALRSKGKVAGVVPRVRGIKRWVPVCIRGIPPALVRGNMATLDCCFVDRVVAPAAGRSC